LKTLSPWQIDHRFNPCHGTHSQYADHAIGTNRMD
jgi:hypothetical protein